MGRAGDRERGEADDGGRRHREDGLVVAEHLARREEDVLEPRERDDVQAPEHELEGRGRPDPLDAEEDDVRLRRVPKHEQRGEPPVLRPRQAARVGPRGAGRGREDRGGGEERDERVARGPAREALAVRPEVRAAPALVAANALRAAAAERVAPERRRSRTRAVRAADAAFDRHGPRRAAPIPLRDDDRLHGESGRIALHPVHARLAAVRALGAVLVRVALQESGVRVVGPVVPGDAPVAEGRRGRRRREREGAEKTRGRRCLVAIRPDFAAVAAESTGAARVPRRARRLRDRGHVRDVIARICEHARRPAARGLVATRGARRALALAAPGVAPGGARRAS